MWTNLQSGLGRFALIQCQKGQGFFKIQTRFSSRINLDNIEDLSVEPDENSMTTRVTYEKYFKAIAKNSGMLTNSIKEIDLNSENESGEKNDKNYIVNARDFAKEVLMYPNKPKFNKVRPKEVRTKHGAREINKEIRPKVF